jgi:plasmid stability protein
VVICTRPHASSAWFPAAPSRRSARLASWIMRAVCGTLRMFAWPRRTGKGRRAIMGYHMEVLPMTDMLIRDVPDDVVAAVDARASRLGLSRSEYVRRRLAQDAATTATPVSVEDLARFMSQAWR